MSKGADSSMVSAPSVEQLRLLLQDREVAQQKLTASGERSGERVEALREWAKDLRVMLHALTGDWYGKPQAGKYRPSSEVLDAVYDSPDAIPLELLNWARKNSVVTSDATDLMRWARVVDTERHERFDSGSMTVFRAIGRGEHFLEVIRPGDWVTPDRAYAEDHLQRWLGGDGQVLEMNVDGRDVLVSPTGNGEEAIYAPLELSGPHVDGGHDRAMTKRQETLMADPVVLSRYIECGDTFGAGLVDNGAPVSAGVVTSVDREVGLVKVKYTMGALSGVERIERPDDPRFAPFVEGRLKRERAENAPEPILYAMLGEVERGDQIRLYEPVRFATGDQVGSAVLRRDEVGEFKGGAIKAVCTEAGMTFFDAVSAPGNQTTYTYMLLREVSTVNRASREVTPVAHGQCVGLTVWDRVSVDQRPGMYYVTARKEGNPPQEALLLGPFSQHLDAMLANNMASRHVIDTVRDGFDYSYGTVRLDVDADAAPVGRFNDVLLSEQERRALPGGGAREPDSDSTPSDLGM